MTQHQYEFLHRALLDILEGRVTGPNWVLQSKRRKYQESLHPPPPHLKYQREELPLVITPKIFVRKNLICRNTAQLLIMCNILRNDALFRNVVLERGIINMMATSQQAARCALTLLLFWVVLSTLTCLNFTSCDRGSLADNFGVFHHQFHVNTFKISSVFQKVCD